MAVVFGMFTYFPTLVEVPVAHMFLDLGMHRGLVLDYLMADPEPSLQSILMLAAVIGRPKAFTCVGVVAPASVVAGPTCGVWVDGASLIAVVGRRPKRRPRRRPVTSRARQVRQPARGPVGTRMDAVPLASLHSMKLFGIAGHSGMGKTTLLERLVPELTARGLVVSLVKHSHKSIEIDRPGKDSHRLREAGCMEVLLLGNERWALMHELRGAAEPPLDYLVGRLQRCDLVLIEGFKQGDFPKLEVWRAALGKPTLWPRWPGIVAIASDTPQALPPGPLHADLADVHAIADLALAYATPYAA